jgi:PAS domain S-box-containing protein
MKIKTASLTLIVSLLLLALVISALSILNQSKTQVVEELWQEFDEARSDRLNAILEIRREMGFGGMIHHYKNFILRSKATDKDAVIASIGGVQSAIERYRALEISTTERNALSDIETTLNLYTETLTTISALQRRQRTPNEIDAAVKINDKTALAALNKLALEAKYIDNVRPDSKNTNKSLWLGKLRTALGYGGLIHAFKNYILRGTPESLVQLEAKVNEIHSIVDSYQQFNINEIEKNALRKVLQVVSLYYERLPIIESMLNTHAVANRIDNAVIVDDLPAVEGLNELYREIVRENKNQSMRLKSSLDIALKSGQTIFVTTVVAFLLIIIWAVWLLRYKITRPLIQLNANMTSLAKEDLEVDISGVNAQTEIGDMARAVEVFKLNAIDKLKMEAALKQSNERLEEAVNDRTQALRSKEKRLSSLIENTVDAIITIDQHGTIQSFNTAAILMFGYSANEVVGKNVKCLMPEPYRSEHDGYLTNYLNTAEKKIIGVGREALAKRKKWRRVSNRLSCE